MLRTEYKQINHFITKRFKQTEPTFCESYDTRAGTVTTTTPQQSTETSLEKTLVIKEPFLYLSD